MRHLLHRFVVTASIAVALATPALAQNTLTLEGLVKSEAGPISGAQVTIVNAATQETAQAITRATGDFRVIGLFAGQYTVTVRAVGYKPARETVQLVIGQRARLDFTMERGVAELAATTVSEERVKQVEVQRLSALMMYEPARVYSASYGLT